MQAVETPSSPHPQQIDRTSPDRMAAFSFLVALSGFIHLLSFPADYDQITAYLVVVTNIVLFLVPRSLGAMVAFSASVILHRVNLLPYVPNHLIFESIVLATIAIATVGSGVGLHRKTLQAISARAYTSLRPILMTQLILLYAFAGIHKLNLDFLDPEVSCAVIMQAGVAESLGLPPPADWTHYPAILITLVLELGIPALLCFASTRWIAIFAGIGFHVLLAIHPHGGIYSFSFVMFYLYFLFLPDDVANALTERWSQSILSTWTTRGIVTVVFIATTVAQVRLASSGASMLAVNRLGFLFWACAAGWLCTYYVIYLGAHLQSGLPTTHRLDRPPAWLWLMVAIVVLNGTSPYVGFKTTPVFSMFSNLRTEGEHNNHLLLPRLSLFGYQDDLVEVIESDHPLLSDIARQGDLLTWFELKRNLSEVPHTSATIRRNGVEMMLHPDAQTPESKDAYTKHAWWIRRFIRFRSIRNFDRKMDCRH